MRRLVPVLLLAACDGGTATGLACPTTERVAVDIDVDATALEAWEAGKAIADATFDADATWLGGMAGLSIARDGTPKEGALVTGWAFTFCDGMSQVGFSVGPPQSAGECAVDAVDCSQIPAFEPFSVDSADVIAAAFPDGGADDTYSLQLVLLVGPNWTVTDLGSGAIVNVDPYTGNVVD